MDKLEFGALVTAFKKICDDYDTVVHDRKAETKVLSFCNKMIFIIGPRADELKQSPKKHLFTLQFDNDGTRSVFISTDLSDNAENKIRTFNNGMQLILTPRQGSLLAVSAYYRMIEFVAKNDNNPNLDKFITPIAADVFSTSDLLQIAAILDVEQHIALIILNESCLSGGYFLQHSDVNVALVAVMESTKFRDVEIKSEIVMKCLAEYAHRGKQIDIVTFSRLSQYATGGLPYHCRYKVIVDSYNKLRYNEGPPSPIAKQALLQDLISQYATGKRSFEILAAIFETSKDVPLIGVGKVHRLVQLSILFIYLTYITDNPTAPDGSLESMFLGVGGIRLSEAK